MTGRDAATDPYRIVEAPARRIRPLRAAVLRDGDLAAATWPGDDDSLHLAALAGDPLRDEAVLGCLSLLAQSCPERPEVAAWRLRGMAVAEMHRGRGVGAALLVEAGRRAAAERIGLIWCNARTTALGFYRSAGWHVVGEEFLTDTGIPHYRALWEFGEPAAGQP
jgi:GNAT superfamily N-acetyltransferase